VRIDLLALSIGKRTMGLNREETATIVPCAPGTLFLDERRDMGRLAFILRKTASGLRKRPAPTTG
jgi:hypothetical protein